MHWFDVLFVVLLRSKRVEVCVCVCVCVFFFMCVFVFVYVCVCVFTGNCFASSSVVT